MAFGVTDRWAHANGMKSIYWVIKSIWYHHCCQKYSKSHAFKSTSQPYESWVFAEKWRFGVTDRECTQTI
jgi:hypothetical protein